MNRILAVLLVGALIACQEEITPLIRKTPPIVDDIVMPSEPVAGKYANCLSILSNNTLDVATWNIENFPLDGSITVPLLTEMIETMDADIIAVQEINSTANFDLLMANLEEYEGVIVGSGQQRLGYIYKTSEITSFQTPTQLFTDDACAFPRPALKTTITHVSGEVVHFINVHLKCCDDTSASCGSSITRRKNAADKIKGYIEQNLASASVIVLGDYNEDLTEPEGNGVFTTLINDATNFKFADMSIATGPASGFSYPSWPSHLDHILVTNELFDNLGDIRTVRFNACESQYFTKVSDHYPVLLRLKDLN